ncbi:hypothetical protein FRB94_008270 [Tulasnella sp. JGI-2019a]|nr:hypothetical protein FRB94_008270 [Tulasnella sp. JGI-2019a]KAG9030873.1 hypothetical protein FRB95_003436 [Tulasnella sp. JGI-2019a]
MFGITLHRSAHTKLALLLLPGFVLLVLFRRRTYIAACLAYTYFAFTFLHTSIIGKDDGFDLPGIKAPVDALEIVPRILHQVRLGGLPMRPKWTKARQSCLDLHGNWTIKMWEDDAADTFVLSNYPDLFDMYRGYGQEIQRSNVIRYLILYKEGGVYLDLDVKCKVPLDPFLTQSWLSPPGVPAGINNAFLTSTPGNPFLSFVIERLRDYDLYWISPYATNMFSAGCHFISTMHALYPERHLPKVLPKEYKLGGLSFTPMFDHLGAGSWHRWDAAAIKVIGKVVEWILAPWKIILTIVCSVGFVVRRKARNSQADDKENGGRGSLETRAKDA